MAKQSHSRAKSVLGGKSKSKGKSGSKPHSIHVRRGKSGGFIAEHHFKSSSPTEMPQENEEHVLPDMDSLKDHMEEHMGDQPDQEAEAAPPPAAAQGAGMAQSAGM